MRAPTRLAAAAALAVAVLCASTLPAEAAPTARHFANCTEVHKTYPAGIATPKVKYNTVAGRTKAITGKPKRDLALYKRNIGLDRDKDHIACELG